MAHDSIVSCATCSAAHHPECWRAYGGCSSCPRGLAPPRPPARLGRVLDPAARSYDEHLRLPHPVAHSDWWLALDMAALLVWPVAAALSIMMAWTGLASVLISPHALPAPERLTLLLGLTAASVGLSLLIRLIQKIRRP